MPPAQPKAQATTDPSHERIEAALREGKCRLEELCLKSLTADHRYQARVKPLDADHVERLDFAFQLGELHPVTAFRFRQDGQERLALVDGFHRREVYRRAGRPTIRAFVINGTEADALAFAAGANQMTMLDRTLADVRKAIFMLFDSPGWLARASEWVADQVGAGPNVVTKWRAQFCAERGVPFPARLEGRDGRTFANHAAGTPPAAYTNKRGTASLRAGGRKLYLGTGLSPEQLGESAAAALSKVEARRGAATEAVNDPREYFARRGLALDRAPTTPQIGGYWCGRTAVTCAADSSIKDCLRAVAVALIARDAVAAVSGACVLVATRSRHVSLVANAAAPLGVLFVTPDELEARLMAERGLADEPGGRDGLL